MPSRSSHAACRYFWELPKSHCRCNIISKSLKMVLGVLHSLLFKMVYINKSYWVQIRTPEGSFVSTKKKRGDSFQWFLVISLIFAPSQELYLDVKSLSRNFLASYSIILMVYTLLNIKFHLITKDQKSLNLACTQVKNLRANRRMLLKLREVNADICSQFLKL